MGHIPCGMELFPAAPDKQWTVITKFIDVCDYYVVVVGGRYGSTGPDGKSYTHMEYEYAVSQDMPVAGFYHKHPETLAAIRTEGTDEGKRKLKTFRDLVQTRMCKPWSSPAELARQVVVTMNWLITNNPRTGWVRADAVANQDALAEIARLRRKV